VKPFIGTLRVTNPARESRASDRKRVLRGGEATLTAKRSEIRRCAIEPRNYHRGEPSSLTHAEAAPGISYTWTHRRAWSHRGRRARRMIRGVPRELGRPCRLRRDCRSGARLTKLQADPRLPSRACGDESGMKRWYRQAKELTFRKWRRRFPAIFCGWLRRGVRAGFLGPGHSG
jgi:hypothetical protein